MVINVAIVAINTRLIVNGSICIECTINRYTNKVRALSTFLDEAGTLFDRSAEQSWLFSARKVSRELSRLFFGAKRRA